MTMLHDLHNPTRATRIVHDVQGNPIRLAPGDVATGVALPETMVRTLEGARGDLEVRPHVVPAAADAVFIDGMWGIGDNIHQRAVLRELMPREEVWLSTCHWHVYHDLVATERLHLSFKSTRLRAQAKTIARERDVFRDPPPFPAGGRRIKLWYRKDQIDRYGSITQAMAGVCGVDHTRPLDFSLPVPDAWGRGLPEIDTRGRPLMVYRPIVLRKEWNSANRNPDPAAYRALYDAIRAGYYVVSVADLLPGAEWIVGEEAPADLKLHRGELDFQGLAALFRRADLAFCNAGFGPVLAQAVGTPVVVLYGGRESYRTTDRAGEHLAPTLGIDPIRPCDCHAEACRCGGDKRVDVPAALARVRQFASEVRPRRASVAVPVVSAAPSDGDGREEVTSASRPAGVASDLLVFATTYVDNPDRQHLTELWVRLHGKMNPDADLLIVDSASPLPVVSEDFRAEGHRFEQFDFFDNIGHLSRGGKDGWGRAFCMGLETAVEKGYKWVVHVEGDSLLRVPVRPILEQMARQNRGAASTPVRGTNVEVPQWVETGLMFFSTDWLRKSGLVAKYNWPVRKERPTPEKVLFHAIGGSLLMLPLRAFRSDKKQLHRDTVASQNHDWITHAHDDVWVYDRFFEAAMKGKEVVPPEHRPPAHDARPATETLVVPPRAALRKINLGCGTNRLPGWENHDRDVDVSAPLPWGDATVDFILIEHCLEHVPLKKAIGFLEEAFRVLRPGGVLRVVVPSVEQVWAANDRAYWEFARKWGGEATRRGATRAILHAHGHEMAWTASLMRTLLEYVGYANVNPYDVGVSPYPELRGVEGHGTVIGEAFNEIESMVFEAMRPGAAADGSTALVGDIAPAVPSAGRRVAVILGGGADVEKELARARDLIRAAGAVPMFFAINDMIPRFPGPCVAVTLHPMKAKGWLAERAAAGFPPPQEVWAHQKGTRSHPVPEITHVSDDWRGSSGLLAVKIALQKYSHDRIVLCGVPMRTEDGHFVRGKPWAAAPTFRLAWGQRRQEIARFVRSMSGWTADQFGRPDVTFLS